MHIYEVVSVKTKLALLGIESSVVIAKSPGNAVRLIVDSCNEELGFEYCKESDFEAGNPIDPNNSAEETIISKGVL